MKQRALVVAVALMAGNSFANDVNTVEGDFVIRDGNEILYYEAANTSGFADAGLMGTKVYIEDTGDGEMDAAVSNLIASIGATAVSERANAKFVVKTEFNRGYSESIDSRFVKQSISDARTGAKPDFSKFMRPSCYGGDDMVRLEPALEINKQDKQTYFPWGRKPDKEKVIYLGGSGAATTGQFVAQSVGMAGGSVALQLVSAFVGGIAQGYYDRTQKGCDGFSSPFFPNSNHYGSFVATGFFKNAESAPAVGVVRSSIRMKGLDATPAVENHIRVLKAFSKVDA